MLAYQHSGFSVGAGVRIEAHDRAALKLLSRYCARLPLAMERLRIEVAALVYRCSSQHSEPAGDKRGAKVDELTLTPLELISPARGPPLWEDCGDAQMADGTQIEPDWDLAAQPAPDYEMDQRVTE